MANLHTWRPPRWVAHVLGASNVTLLVAAGVLFALSLDAPWTGWGIRGGTFPIQVALLVISWILAARRPANPIGWILAVAELFLGIDSVAVYLDLFAALRGWSLDGVAAGLLQTSWVAGITLVLLALAMFPTGAVSATWSGRAVRLLFLPAVLGAGIANFAASQHLGAAASIETAGPLDALFAFYSLFALSVVIAVVQRFRRSSGVERQQLRWVIYAVAAYAASLIPTGANPVVADVLAVLHTLLMTLVVVAVGTAILRYRLYDLDRIVSRTLVWLLLTGIVVAVWVGVALAPTVIIGTSEVNNVTIAVATLAAMAVAQPLRTRLQAVIDRRLHRSRYDAQQAIERLGIALADEVDHAAMHDRVTGTLARTLQPRTVAVWTPIHAREITDG